MSLYCPYINGGCRGASLGSLVFFQGTGSIFGESGGTLGCFVAILQVAMGSLE